jgi:tryptophan synthase alpha chain
MEITTTRTQAVLEVFQQDQAAFMPYFTMGYPDMETSLTVIEACAANGASLIEIGVPFSDPLADGPTIQHSTQVALQNGITVAGCLAGVKTLRERGVTIPLILMGYYNPILAYGVEKFVADAFAAGAHGFIVPDLPPDEAGMLRALCLQYGLALNFLLAPNSPDERIELVTEQSTGFIYLVSVIGITGERKTLPEDLTAFVERVKSFTNKPVAVGFGISTPEQARVVGRVADGVIVGSALVKTVRDAADAPRAAGQFVKQMVFGLQAKE